MNKAVCLHIFERYVSGEASPDEVLQLKSFLEQDANLNEWMENQIMSSSHTIESEIKAKLLENIRSQTGYNTQTGYGTPHTSRFSFRNFKLDLKRFIDVAAVLLILVFCAQLYLKPQKIESFEIVAGQGKKTSLTLSEGSKVVINSGSKIIYDSNYNLKDRSLKLEGEAFFDVKYDPEKPFIVECKDIKIKVLGTSFDVKAYQVEDHISIVLTSGKIKLTTPKEEIEMFPNDRIVYNKTTQITILEKINTENYMDWMQDYLRFENESLGVIMKTISQIYNVKIVFEDPGLETQRFTGTIDNTSINSVLDAIKLTSSISYRTEDGVIYLYDRN
ncbi:MAG: DUF4974 domain-containing protein [Dysgonamonadaceae bacterium]|jgi:ferric-dicitrate binding protein FerR (iron transport regulator)|nr:DUF4974 domain-containing protein [Dysgonamonadaceae bacterium]